MLNDYWNQSWGGVPQSLSPLATPVYGFGSPAPMQAPMQDPGLMASFSEWLKNSGALSSTTPQGIKTDGWGGLALGAAQGIGNSFMAMQQYGLAKDTLNQNKREFNMNYDAQRKTTNAALSDRQAARVASNPNAYQSVGDYMDKYGVR